MNSYSQGETVTLQAVLSASVTPLVKILAPDGTVLVSQTSTGVVVSAAPTYTYPYDISASAALGVCSYEWYVDDSSDYTIDSGFFEVIAREGASADYTNIGYSPNEAQVLISDAMGQTTPSDDELRRTYDAMTYCGQAAATWHGTNWWWLHGTSSFSTVASTASYALRTVNSAAMVSLWAVERAYYDDDWPLESMTWRDYQRWYTIERPTASTNQPYSYSVVGKTPTMYFRPIPDAVYTIYVDYIKRHPRLTSGMTKAAMIVPDEYQRGIYIEGAIWLLRHNIQDVASLEQCPGFMEAIGRMYASQPESYDKDAASMFPDTVGHLPHDRKVFPTPDGYLIMNPVSL